MMEALVNTQTELEDFGVMTEEWKEDSPTYNLRALFAYCKKVGKRPVELSDSEREQFRTN
ncbi:MAG: hypothetical protein IJI71_10315 [Clostridia bacterium]|nr:hypothetical protein [Clostridia bacterium]